LEKLERRLTLNSGNSSRPPSTDPPGTKLPPKKKPSGRRPGGQPGHPGAHRELVPPERVDKFEDVWPAQCGDCQRPLDRGIRTEMGEPIRHQVAEVPQVRAEITEYRLHAQHCEGCGRTTRAPLPPGVPSGAFGIRLRAVVALFVGAYRISRRVAVEALGDLFGADLSLGSVANVEQAMSAALAKPVDKAVEHAQREPVGHADETGWREGKQKAWLWVLATPTVAVFKIQARRNTAAARKLLNRFAGILVTDRWSAYLAWPLRKRQLCWAHLLRDFQFISECRGTATQVGQQLLKLTEELFTQWHRVRDGTMSRRSFQLYINRIRPQFEAQLKRGAGCYAPKVSGMCQEILGVFNALWTFARIPGVEPTNNFAERTLRFCVLWRKTSFGTKCDAGSRFAERMMTTVATLKLQKRNVLDFLVDVSEAAILRSRPPSLLPARP
jgi:transposase